VDFSHDNVAARLPLPQKKVNRIEYACVVLPGRKAVANGLDYNLSLVFNQVLPAASRWNPVFA
jgi:hypothetical protein